MSDTEIPDETTPLAPDPRTAAPAAAESPDDGTPDAEAPLIRMAFVIVGIAILAALAWTWSPDDGTSTVLPAVGNTGAVGDAPSARRLPPVLVNVFAALDDRFVSEPCNRIPGGGMFSMRTVTDMMDGFLPSNLTVFMGDLSQAPGMVGAVTTQFHYRDVLPLTGVDIVAAGEGELAHGVDFVRDVLGRPVGYTVLCANALDGSGQPILRGWSLTSVSGRNVLTVAVAGKSVGYELVRRGSNVVIGSPAEAAAAALSAGIARAEDVESPADTKLLLVHGTLAEAEEVMQQVGGFDLVVAADGPVLPELTPRTVNGTPLYYAGRGARFSWRVIVTDDERMTDSALARIGGGLIARGSPYQSRLAAIRSTLRRGVYPGIATPDRRPADPRGEYAGGAACADCHPQEAAQHVLGPHAMSPKGFVETDFSGSTGCLSCHVTAPYVRGGWYPSDTGSDSGTGTDSKPDAVPPTGLGADGISCEACHGPGADHAATGGPDYGSVNYARCYECHLPDRTPALDARAVWAEFGHGAVSAPPRTPEAPDGGGDDDE